MGLGRVGLVVRARHTYGLGKGRASGMRVRAGLVV